VGELSVRGGTDRFEESGAGPNEVQDRSTIPKPEFGTAV
jgi:hypothetical protein